MSIEEIDVKIAELREDYSTVKGTPCEVNTRVVGYYRNVHNFNVGKVEEYKDRKTFLVPSPT
jgi:anaerobic ribonucleoside-triphosphate reductase